MVLKKVGLAVAVGAFILGGIASCGNAGGPAPDGKKLFEQHCAVCHKDGGNIINPKKTLKSQDREANGVKSASDIVKLMRNPGPGMSKFDEKTISNKEAKAIAEYVMKTF